ncbi:Putative 115 kDa protein in type-1 retrotransposable element R1DM [Anthophora quadrimaculata]
MLKFRLQCWCEANSILTRSQAGFRIGRSCQDNIGSIIIEANNSLMRSECTVAAFLDVSSNVHFNTLIEILANLGLAGNILNFISNLIYRRKAIIASDSPDITTRDLYKGVPQGGVLSSLLFNLYTKNILPHLPPHTKLMQFADTIAITVTHKSRSTAISTLEDSVESVRKNLLTLGLELFTHKTQFLSFNTGNTPPRSLHLKVNGQRISNLQTARFLEVQIDQHLKFDAHILNLSTHCHQTLNILRSLRGTWWGCGSQTLLTIFKSLIRSKIEYGTWWLYPTHNNGLASKSKQLQAQAAKLALGLRSCTPNNVALAEARLPPIEVRARYLGSKYILQIRIGSFHNNPISTLLLEFHRNYSDCHKGLLTKKVRGALLFQCLSQITPFHGYIEIQQHAPCYHSNPHLQLAKVNTNTSLGILLQTSPAPNCEFNSYFSNSTPNHILIYTDSPKMQHSLFTGATYVCPQLSTGRDISLNPISSIFTAECAAISMTTDLANNNRELSYTICSDSLNAIQAIDGKPFNMVMNPYIVKIKEGLQDFAVNSPSGSSISLLWVLGPR